MKNKNSASPFLNFGHPKDDQGKPVMISEESFNNLMENIHVVGHKANYDWLMESKAQLENGKFSTHDLTKVTEDE